MTVHVPPVEGETVSDLQDRFRGTRLRSNDEGYDDARTIWTAMIDRTPAVIAQCEGVTDVIAAVNFGRKHDLPHRTSPNTRVLSPRSFSGNTLRNHHA